GGVYASGGVVCLSGQYEQVIPGAVEVEASHVSARADFSRRRRPDVVRRLKVYPRRRTYRVVHFRACPNCSQILRIINDQGGKRCSCDWTGNLRCVGVAEPVRARPMANARILIPHVRCSDIPWVLRSEEHTSELQSRQYLVCRLLLEK